MARRNYRNKKNKRNDGDPPIEMDGYRFKPFKDKDAEFLFTDNKWVQVSGEPIDFDQQEISKVFFEREIPKIRDKRQSIQQTGEGDERANTSFLSDNMRIMNSKPTLDIEDSDNVNTSGSTNSSSGSTNSSDSSKNNRKVPKLKRESTRKFSAEDLDSGSDQPAQFYSDKPLDEDFGEDPDAGNKEGNVINVLTQAALDTGNIIDIVRGTIGLKGAMEELPEYERPDAWKEHLSNVEILSQEGLSPEEEGLFEQDVANQYATESEQIRGISGGRAGVALSNIGQASRRAMSSRRRLMGLDEQVQRQYTSELSGLLSRDLGIDYNNFGREFNVAAQNKMSAAQLANQSIQSLIDRREYERTYGEGSEYEKLMEAQREELELSNEYMKASMDWMANNMESYDSLPTGG